MGIRRVVTGHSEAGKAIVASDEVIEPITLDLFPGSEFFRLWGADEPVRLPDSDAQPPHDAYFPPVGGFRFGLFTVPPDSTTPIEDGDMAAAVAEIQVKLPGLTSYMELNSPGMHTTATVDYEFVVSGSVVLELDDGTEVELHPGDTVVQNGTRHAWRNRGTEPCQLVVAIVGADHERVKSADSLG